MVGVGRIDRLDAQLEGADCTRVAGRTLLLPQPPSHSFHFLLEWAFHLFAHLAVHTRPPQVVLLPARRQSRLDAGSSKIYRALLGHFGRVHHATDGRVYCLERAQIGLVPAVSLVASRCLPHRRLADARAGGGLASCRATPWSASAAALPADLARARALTNCSLTRSRLRAFRSLVRARLGVPSVAPPSSSALAMAASDEPAGASVRVLLVQRSGASRRLLALPAFARRLSEELRARLRLPAGGVAIDVGDFGADLVRNGARLQRYTALIAVHGNALTNLVLTPSKGALRGAVQLLPSCLPEGTLSNHAYEVLGHVLLAGRFRSVCCDCEAPQLGKLSQVSCNATRTAHVLAGLLRR